MVRILGPGIMERGDDIGTIAQDMDETRGRQMAADLVDEEHVLGGLLEPATPAAQARLVGYQLIEQPAGIGEPPHPGPVVAALEGIVRGDEANAASTRAPSSCSRSSQRTGRQRCRWRKKWVLLEGEELELAGQDGLQQGRAGARAADQEELSHGAPARERWAGIAPVAGAGEGTAGRSEARLSIIASARACQVCSAATRARAARPIWGRRWRSAWTREAPP